MNSNLILILFFFSIFISTIFSTSLLSPTSPPTPPKWPPQFSSGIDDVKVDGVSVGRWFYDQDKNSERFDLESNQVSIIEINRYDLGKKYLIERERDTKPTCTVSTITQKKISSPDFSTFIFGGQLSVRGLQVDKWTFNESDTISFEYLDDHWTQDPVSWSRRAKDRPEEIVHFWEFDRGSQESSLFNVSYVFPGFCKTETTSNEPKSNGELILDPQVCNKASQNARYYSSCGCPYVWGGISCGCSGKGGMDCSGLTYTSYRGAGWTGIARTAAAQAQQGGSCGSCSPSNTGPCHEGDLFFYNFGDITLQNQDISSPLHSLTIDHVVMYIGGGFVAECPHTGLNCRVIHPYSQSYVTCRRFC